MINKIGNRERERVLFSHWERNLITNRSSSPVLTILI
jgi:hypothetical protein